MKESIVEKASEMFLTLGFKSVTMDDIAREMGISKKTIYVHYSNKAKLVDAVSFYLFDNICSGIDHICDCSANPIEELYDIKMFVMKHLKKEQSSPQYQLKKYYPDTYKKLHAQQFKKMHETVQESLQKGVDTGLFRSKLDVDFVARLYFNGMIGIKDDSIFPSELFSKEYLLESFLEYHLRAIVSPKGMTILNKFITA
ncbi:MAG: TetR/AcrR family transcriptional regulator [Gilvibacter sp.]